MAYKVFTNGSPLPASDLNTYLMNQSVMVFANSTARSAALTSPTEGMVTYLEDTNKVEVYTGAAWVDVNDNAAAIPKSTVTTAGDLIVADGNASVTRLGIGTNGQVLSSNGTTATWTTPATGGGFVQLASVSLSGTQTDITSISGSYKALKLVLRDVNSTADFTLRFRFNSDTNSNYFRYLASSTTYATSKVAFYSPQSGNVESSVGNLTQVTLEIEDYATSATIKKIFATMVGADTTVTADRRSFVATGGWENTSAITSINIIEATGGSFSSGTAILYGVN